MEGRYYSRVGNYSSDGAAIMTLERSVLLLSPQPRETQVQTRNHAWCRPEVGPDNHCTWGTVTMMDPGGKGYDEPYRVGGEDVDYFMVARSLGPPTRDGNCGQDEPWFPFCDELTYGIFVVKGDLPHHTEDEYGYLNEPGTGYNFVDDVLCKIYLDGGFAYFLYKDKSLDNVCNPGGHFTMLTRSDLPTQTHIYKPKDSYQFDGTRVDTPLVSGTTRIHFKPY